MSPETHRDPVLIGGLIFGLLISAGVHVGLAVGVRSIDTSVSYADAAGKPRVRKAKLKRRWSHGPVAFERRKIELDCDSIPECEPMIEAQIVEMKVAKLGGAEPDPKKLPEIQKYEEPEKDELQVNTEEEPPKVKPRNKQDFMRRKAQLDRRRRKRKPKRNLFNLDDDPRARPTAFERITGRLDGDVYGRGVDQEKFDTYFGKMAFELHREFNPPTSLSRKVILKQLVRVLITGMNPDGTIASYRIKRKARKPGFTMAAQAALRAFMPTEGGKRRFPTPPPDILAFVNKKGIIIDLDGRLFE